jgi:hypothetical protein
MILNNNNVRIVQYIVVNVAKLSFSPTPKFRSKFDVFIQTLIIVYQLL